MALVFSAPAPCVPSGPEPVVLIVDDEPAIGQLFAAVVLNAGFTPVVARSGAEAFRKLAQLGSNVALILLDVFMPEMDGFAFRARQLNQPQVADIPTVMVSGDTLSEQELSRLRPQGWLTKPMRIDQLRDTIVGHIRRAGAAARGQR